MSSIILTEVDSTDWSVEFDSDELCKPEHRRLFVGVDSDGLSGVYMQTPDGEFSPCPPRRWGSARAHVPGPVELTGGVYVASAGTTQTVGLVAGGLTGLVGQFGLNVSEKDYYRVTLTVSGYLHTPSDESFEISLGLFVGGVLAHEQKCAVESNSDGAAFFAALESVNLIPAASDVSVRLLAPTLAPTPDADIIDARYNLVINRA